MLGSDGQQCCVRLQGAVEKVKKEKKGIRVRTSLSGYLRRRLGVNIHLPGLAC